MSELEYKHKRSWRHCAGVEALCASQCPEGKMTRWAENRACMQEDMRGRAEQVRDAEKAGIFWGGGSGAVQNGKWTCVFIESESEHLISFWWGPAKDEPGGTQQNCANCGHSFGMAGMRRTGYCGWRVPLVRRRSVSGLVGRAPPHAWWCLSEAPGC